MKCVASCIVNSIYFYHVLLPMTTILEIPWLFQIWNDPKLEGSMYRKDFVSSQHLPHSKWYLDYFNNYTLAQEIKVQSH
jgi:hypothetical protein